MSDIKEIKMILRLFQVIAMYCQASSSQIKSITQPPMLLAGWEGSLGTLVAVGLSRILKGKQELGLTFNSYKLKVN